MSKRILTYYQVKGADHIGGCEYYRQQMPHQALIDYYNYEIKITNSFKAITDDELLKFDAVHLIRRDYAGVIDRCKRMGIPTIFDIDDYWQLYFSHPLNSIYHKQKYSENVINALTKADVVTCSTELLANQIKKVRSDVIILPNSILEGERQFENIKYPKSEKLHIGWIGGSMHEIDIELIRESMQKVWDDPDLCDKIVFVFGGYVSNHPLYHKFLHYISGGGNKKAIDNIILLPPTNVNEFAFMYDQCHVMLAPLRKNLFNECKSELKVVEAGWKGKAVIASNIEPYNKFKNVILVEERKGHKDWYKAIKYLTNNPDKVKELQQNLHDEVVSKHNLKENICKLEEIYRTMTS